MFSPRLSRMLTYSSMSTLPSLFKSTFLKAASKALTSALSLQSIQSENLHKIIKLGLDLPSFFLCQDHRDGSSWARHVCWCVGCGLDQPCETQSCYLDTHVGYSVARPRPRCLNTVFVLYNLWLKVLRSFEVDYNWFKSRSVHKGRFKKSQN